MSCPLATRTAKLRLTCSLFRVDRPTAKRCSAWWCCRCRHAKQVIHYSRERPFELRNCANCYRVSCSACLTTNILGQDMVGRPPCTQIANVVPHYDDQEFPYGLMSQRADKLSYDQLGVRVSVVQFDQLHCIIRQRRRKSEVRT
ncbi:hypothetical protein PMIN01_11309 [Paraphaeosphaeria minitans]|uniref:Probable double zinc ribbon domain-containing protein n=1 Tax=Paraphaeosphaeria minitans TaxID=565426 RepID=A0A9P6G8K0_9PLEO|nr:hypothetical protein PMIN01_11309 [Paraphaeosphaeria minitans]